MQGLAAQKVHGPHGFQTHHGWNAHPTFDQRIGDALDEYHILGAERGRVGDRRKGMPDSFVELTQSAHEMIPREGPHRG